MPDLSQHAQFLLNQLRGRLKGANQRGFYFIEDIQSIAFGPLLGGSNTIPPANAADGQGIWELRRNTKLALSELVRNRFVLFHGYTEGHKTYVMNPNKPN